MDNRADTGATAAFEDVSAIPPVLANLLVARNSGATAVSGAAGTLVNSTIAGNRAAGLALAGRWRVTNSVLANNSPGNCQFTGAGALDNGGSNLQFPNNSCSGSIAVSNPMLDDFFVPDPQSPLQNAGIDAVCVAAPVFARDVYGQHARAPVTARSAQWRAILSSCCTTSEWPDRKQSRVEAGADAGRTYAIAGSSGS